MKSRIDGEVADSGVKDGTYLHSLTGSLAKHIVGSRIDNTSSSYVHAFKRWENFISEQDLPALPAHPIHVALYLTHLLDSGASCNVVNKAVYAIKWAHNLNGLSDPTDNSFVKSLQDCEKTRMSQNKKKRSRFIRDVGKLLRTIQRIYRLA